MLARVALFGVAAVTAAACATTETERCEDGTFCPAGSHCGPTGVCLVEPEACGEFGENAPCGQGGASGFCRADRCEEGIVVSGRITPHVGVAGIEGLSVTALDRPWMAADVTDGTGGFELVAVREDRSLVVSIAGNAEYAPARSRHFDVGTERYDMNGRAGLPLRTLRRASLALLAELGGVPHDPNTGSVWVAVGRQPGDALGNATVALWGDAPARVMYVGDDERPDPALSATAPGSGAAVFFEVPPGRYELTADHELATRCAGAGADQPSPVQLEVVAGEVTSAGWMVCEMAAAE